MKDELVYADLCRFVFCRPPQDPSEFPKQSLAPALWHGFQRVHHIVDPGVVHGAALAGLHCLEPDIHLAVSFIGSAGPNRVPQKIVWRTLQKLGGKFTDLRVQTHRFILLVPTAPCSKASRSMLEISPPADQSGASGVQSPEWTSPADVAGRSPPKQETMTRWRRNEMKIMAKPCKAPDL